MDDFDRGYEFVALEGIGSLHGMDSAEWLNKVESSIRELYSAMGSYDHYKANTVAQRSLKGFIAEEWAYERPMWMQPSRVCHSKVQGSIRTIWVPRMLPSAMTCTS